MRVFLLLLLVFLAGCATGPVAYKKNPPLEDVPKAKFRIAVADFENLEPAEDLSEGAMKMEIFIPFWVYHSARAYKGDHFYEYSTQWPPEYKVIRGRRKTFNQCLAEDLASSGLFRETALLDWGKLSADHNKYDFILSGTVISDSTNICVWPSLGLSLPGFILVTLFPLIPSGNVSRTLTVEYKLVKPGNPSFPVWKETVVAENPGYFLRSNMFATKDMYGILAWPDKNLGINRDTPGLYRKQIAKLEELLAEGLKPGGDVDKALKAGK